MVSRILSMPSMVRRTATPPFLAISTERDAISADSLELLDTSLMETAISLMAVLTEVISCACRSDASAR